MPVLPRWNFKPQQAEGYGNCSKPKKLWDETKLEAGLNASLPVSRDHGIGTKHVRAGFEAGLEGLKAMEIGSKQCQNLP